MSKDTLDFIIKLHISGVLIVLSLGLPLGIVSYAFFSDRGENRAFLIYFLVMSVLIVSTVSWIVLSFWI